MTNYLNLLKHLPLVARNFIKYSYPINSDEAHLKATIRCLIHAQDITKNDGVTGFCSFKCQGPRYSRGSGPN